MKGLKTLAALVLATGLLATAASATARPVAYKHYVGCGLSRKAKPAHVCPRGSKKGAFFESTERAVYYSICVRFPSGKTLCANHQPPTKQNESPEAGVLYVNKITSTIPGKHVVTWFVGGKKVGSWAFQVKG